MSAPKVGTWWQQPDLFGGIPVFVLVCPHCSRSTKFTPSGLADDIRKYPITRRCPKCRGKVIYAPQG